MLLGLKSTPGLLQCGMHVFSRPSKGASNFSVPPRHCDLAKGFGGHMKQAKHILTPLCAAVITISFV